MAKERARPEETSSAAAMPPGHDLGLWFEEDEDPGFVLDSNGRFLCANIEGRALIADERLKLLSTQDIRLGDAQSDDELLRGVRRAAEPAHGVQYFIARLRDGDHRPAQVRRTGSGSVVLSFRPEFALTSDGMESLARQFGLTHAESQVLEGLCRGRCPKQIAKTETSSEHTIRAHLRSIYAKLGTRNLTTAALMAVQLLR